MLLQSVILYGKAGWIYQDYFGLDIHFFRLRQSQCIRHHSKDFRIFPQLCASQIMFLTAYTRFKNSISHSHFQ